MFLIQDRGYFPFRFRLGHREYFTERASVGVWSGWLLGWMVVARAKAKLFLPFIPLVGSCLIGGSRSSGVVGLGCLRTQTLEEKNCYLGGVHFFHGGKKMLFAIGGSEY